ncbi:MAG TPA: OmpA family protein, partial [Rhodanobacteraceae bacterium]|nr:OmpA family protein [Rhodanobacteraceae bacterium]
MKRALSALLCVGLLLLASAAVQAREEVDLDYQRLSANLEHLAKDPVLGQYAPAEQARARDSLQQLRLASRKQRPHWLYLSERRIELAYAAAQLEDANHKRDQLASEHSQILLQASRQEADRTRRELERQRVESLAAEEAAQRLQAQGEAYSQQAEQARAEADQAKKLAEAQSQAAALSRKEARLAEAAAKALRANLDRMQATAGRGGMEMTLGDATFAPGKAALQPVAAQHLGKLVQFVQSKPDRAILIEGFTDSSGDSARNQVLSAQRAGAVRDALVAAGVSASRIRVEGR